MRELEVGGVISKGLGGLVGVGTADRASALGAQQDAWARLTQVLHIKRSKLYNLQLPVSVGYGRAGTTMHDFCPCLRRGYSPHTDHHQNTTVKRAGFRRDFSSWLGPRAQGGVQHRSWLRVRRGREWEVFLSECGGGDCCTGLASL